MPQFEAFFRDILLQLVVIIAAARLGAAIFARLGQPQVVGEILSGLILGPSVLGRLNPDLLERFFTPETSDALHVLSELGLTLLMFLIGLEFDFAHLKRVGRTAAAVAGAGIVLPFTLGAALAWSIHAHVAYDVDRLSFVLLMAVALSITAIPILGRIMMELKIQRTSMGTLTITAAAIDDAVGWILLAAVSAIVGGRFAWSETARMIGLTLLFVAAAVLVVRPIVGKLLRTNWILSSDQLTLGGFTLILSLILLSAATTNWIGIFSIFGPFVVGAALSHERNLADAVSARLNPFVSAFFLPIFFTRTGLKTNVGTLDSAWLWGLAALVIAAATFGKMFGCGLAARWGGLSWRDSACVAVMMNTRALMGLIAVNVGREMGLVPDSIFCMLVLMAIVTTVVTTPVLRWMLGPAGAISLDETPTSSAQAD